MCVFTSRVNPVYAHLTFSRNSSTGRPVFVSYAFIIGIRIVHEVVERVRVISSFLERMQPARPLLTALRWLQRMAVDRVRAWLGGGQGGDRQELCHHGEKLHRPKGEATSSDLWMWY